MENRSEEPASYPCHGCGVAIDTEEVNWATPDGVLNTDTGNPYCDECLPAQRGFAWAENILDAWDYHALPDGEEVIAAISKALQALRDCQEMGLNGYGE